MVDHKPVAQIPDRQFIYSDAELALIKAAFADNEPLLKLLRKVFIPMHDVNAPIGQMTDMFMDFKAREIPMDELKAIIVGKQDLVQHLDRGLIILKAIAGTKTETLEETKKRLTSDSSK